MDLPARLRWNGAHVVVLTDFLSDFGGTERYTATTCDLLASVGVAVEVVCVEPLREPHLGRRTHRLRHPRARQRASHRFGARDRRRTINELRPFPEPAARRAPLSSPSLPVSA